MRKRTGDWRDLLSAYALALDAKKIYVGFVATLVTVVLMFVASALYTWLAGNGLVPKPPEALAALGQMGGEGYLLSHFARGTGMHMLGTFLPLLNPFYGELGHFIVSVLLYVALFWIWSGAGALVSRLAALEYARDDLPTLAEARATVKAKRSAYFFAPVMPLAVIVILTVLNALGGLLVNLPGLGRILLIFPGFPLLLATSVTIAFLVVFGVLSFGMMMPAVAVGGKDAFESWSTAYSYVLWGLRRFVCYTLIAGVIGVISAVVAWGLAEFVIYLIYQTVNIGFFRQTEWLTYQTAVLGGRYCIILAPVGTGFTGVLAAILWYLLLAVRALPVAYVFAYFFTANTIIFFLMRKDQDNVEIDELYEEAEEEEGLAEEEFGAPEPAEPAPEEEEPEAEAEPEEESAAEEEAEPEEEAESG
ncbi:MAG: hypothetical protein ACYS8L_10625 [Planctomycetota bacterium]|jgi:hypothetical protein